MNNTLPNSFTLRFFNPAPFGLADSVYLFDSGAEPIPTTIITTQVNGVTYDEILLSQNGAVYQINGLTINIVSAPNDGAKVSQLLKPFIFSKRDVNGNEMRIEKFQAVDPYQQQFSYSFVDLVDEKEIFVLDGNTLFQYEIDPLVKVNVTFNYIELKNSNFGTEESQKELRKDIENDLKLQETSQYAGEVEMVVRDNAVVTNKKKKSINWLYWILGATAVYLLYNPFKTNQK
tara:strand:- start:585 stop:1280 length:696 start_codon:yes stop_codon:yes gene_type:complete